MSQSIRVTTRFWVTRRSFTMPFSSLLPFALSSIASSYYGDIIYSDTFKNDKAFRIKFEGLSPDQDDWIETLASVLESFIVKETRSLIRVKVL